VSASRDAIVREIRPSMPQSPPEPMLVEQVDRRPRPKS
jgi:hypothetical protein